MIGRAYIWLKQRMAKYAGHPLFYSVVLLFTVSYWLIFFYLYRFQGLRAVGWHTHIILPITLYITVYLMVRYILSPLFRWNAMRFLDNWAYGIWVYLVIEIFILVTGVGKVANENNLGQYLAYYEDKSASYYHVWKPGSRHWLSNSEFHYERFTNSLGFADKEWDTEKSEGTYRILCLGDSFTEGDGTHADSTYPVFLEKILRKKYPKVEVFNAGTCGSDPYFNFINLRDRLHYYQPDLIIQTVSAFDFLHDIPKRGGMERFGEGKKLNFVDPPWWEPLYAVSYIFRIFTSAMGYNPDLTVNADIMSNMEKYVQELKKMMNQYAEFCQQRSIQLVLVYLPMKGELEHPERDIVRLKLKSLESSKDFFYKDLYPYYIRNLSSEKGTSVQDYYWKYDGHHNAKGYQLMAENISEAIEQVLPDFFQTGGL